MSSIGMKGLVKRFGDTEVLRGIDLDVRDGEFVVFVGPSGCGKSTLLRCIAGLEEISAGELTIDGRPMNDVPSSGRGLAMVFQSYALYPHMTVAENMSFGLRMVGTPKAETERAVREAAEALQIVPLLDRRPAQLSGGQRQRVAIGRAIVRRPGVFLFDEPLSNLDTALRTQMRIEMARLHETLRATVIYVTHDQAEAMTLADRIVVLNGGRIEQVGAPLELYRRPANVFVAGFLGSPRINLVDATVRSAGPDRVTVTLADGTPIELPGRASVPAPGTPLTLGLRPEALEIAAAGEAGVPGIAATVQLVEHLGDVVYVHAQDADGRTLTVRAAPSTELPLGSALRLRFDPASALVFDAAGSALAPA